jgi:uncharacterized protein YdaU (DUF1376 family)
VAGGVFHVMSEQLHRSPAFQFYADDFMAGTLDLSQEEVGAYIRLLCHQWNRGSIPVETEKQQRLAGGSVSVDVLAKFRLVDGCGLVNDRLEKERAKQAEFRQKQREKGLLSAEARKNQPRFNHGSTKPPTAVQPSGQPHTQPEGNSPVSSLQSSNKEKAHERLRDSMSPWHVAFGLDLPESLQTQECLQASKDWLAYKTEKRQGYKKSGLKAALTKWSNEFTSSTFPAAVQNSMANNWQGVFPLPEPRPQHPTEASPKPEDAKYLTLDGYDWRKSL